MTFPLRWGAEVVVVAVLYWMAAVVGLQFAIPPGNASAVWPPSGIALAALLLRSRAIFPGVWIGAFVANSQTDVSLLTAAAFATGNTVASLVAATLCTIAVDTKNFLRSPQQALLWLVIAAVSSGLAATCGASSLSLAGHITADRFVANWLTWWMGDLTGMMIVAPFLVSLEEWRVSALRPQRLAELIAASMLLLLISLSLFAGWLPAGTAEGLLYLPMIILVWLLLRFGLELVLAGNLLIGAVAVWGTSKNLGAFATESVTQSLLDLQVFLNVYAVTGLALSALLASGRDHELRHLALVSKMKLAHEIQKRLLPAASLRGEKYCCAGVCQPADSVSGDFFDFAAQPDGSVVMTIADVSGHGFGPALLMAETRAYARALLLRHTRLEDVLCELNDFLCSGADSACFVSLAICRFDPRSRELEFIGAGHEGTLVRADGSFQQLHASTPPLGIQKLPTMMPTRVALGQGALLFLCTDGFHEALSSDKELLGMDRIVQALIANRTADIEQLLQACVEQVAGFSGRTTPVDDQTAVVLRVE